MGLSLSHGNFRGPYSYFHRIRVMVANSLGVCTDDNNLYEGLIPLKPGRKDYLKLRDHPIFPFIKHSDCDGVMEIEELKQTIPVLENIAVNWIEGYYKEDLIKIIDSMKRAIELNEPLEFR